MALVRRHFVPFCFYLTYVRRTIPTWKISSLATFARIQCLYHICECCPFKPLWSNLLSSMTFPDSISECGHTFCQKCLTEWFDTSLRTFLIAHPNFNPNAPFPMPLLQVMAIPGAANDPRVRAYMQQHMPAQPQYSCPECRTAVKSAPVENFAMKSLSRMVTSARKEAIPSTPARPREGVWDGYFPVRRT